MPTYSIPIGYVHKVYILTCLTIFGWKIHWDAGGLTGEYDSIEKCFGDDSNLPWNLDDVWPTKEGVVYWGFFDGMLFIGELPSTGNIYLLLSHDSVGIWCWLYPRGGFTKLYRGNFVLQLLRELLLCLGPTGGVRLWYWIYLRFSWRSLLTEEYSWWFLVHLGMFSAFDLLGIFLMVLICWGMILMLLIHRRCFWCMLIQ